MSKNQNVPINLSSLSKDSAGAHSPAGPRGMTPRPGQTVCGDIDMRIDRNGAWFHHGSPIGRKELVKLFASVLRRDDDGDYWLITPAEMARIEVEDAPFMAVKLTTSGDGADQILSLRTNLDATVTVDSDHPIRVDMDPDTGEPSPYVVLDGAVEAKISRAVYYELVSMGVENNHNSDLLGVWSSGIFFSLGSLGHLDAEA